MQIGLAALMTGSQCLDIALLFGGNLTIWRSEKQAVVARSSAEAKFRAMTQGICELLSLKGLLQDLGMNIDLPVRLYRDSKLSSEQLADILTKGISTKLFLPTVSKLGMSDMHGHCLIDKPVSRNSTVKNLKAKEQHSFFSNFVLFIQPVVDAFDPRLLVAPAISHTIDFTSVKEEELYEIEIPLSFIASVGARVHGLACWFDVLFNGSSVQRWLTTAPGAPTTHWYQLRCVLSQPIYVMAGQEITGRLCMVAHNAQSYTMHLTMSAKMWGAGAEQGGILQTSSCKLDLKEPYYRMSQPQAYAWTQDQQAHHLIQSQDAVGSGLVQQSQNSGASLPR
ncbi:probable histone-arginine methyltransferase CARM1 [Telopea speciosissima]|uniref:probable histone-arginine methyltransferase CARM1 n=1 Tax=Telopea speciosissima TaxID=54955 RepID=UPI001CC5E9E1|nr:probable histone-arginine methyltransferase CARM1 [Telopea speciosissima]